MKLHVKQFSPAQFYCLLVLFKHWFPLSFLPSFWKSSCRLKAFYHNMLPSTGTLFLFISSTQKFKFFSTFINTLSRTIAVTSAVIQDCNPHTLSLSFEEWLVDVTPRKMKSYPEVGGGRSARTGLNLCTWRKQPCSAQAPSLSRLHDHTQAHHNR